MTLPARDVELSGDWYERVFGFECVLIEEDEDHVRAVILEHPAGMLLALHVSDGLIPPWRGPGAGPAVLSFRVTGHADLVLWERRLTELGAEHSDPREAHSAGRWMWSTRPGSISSCTPAR